MGLDYHGQQSKLMGWHLNGCRFIETLSPCRFASRPPGVVPLLHVERVLQARGHNAGARPRPGRQRARPARRVPALRGPHQGGRRSAPLHRR